MSFNLSHSQEWILVGVARGLELGVDVEAHQLRTELESMARRVFTARELGHLEGCEPEARLPTFFRGWTRKEAALKATGEGFAREPRTLEVGLVERESDQVWRVADEPVLADYALADLAAPAGFSAAVCALGDSWRVSIVTDRDRPIPLPV